MVLLAGRQRRHFIGWPEKLFVWLNGLFPTLVDRAIGAQREQIHGFAQRPALRLAVPAQPLSSSRSIYHEGTFRFRALLSLVCGSIVGLSMSIPAAASDSEPYLQFQQKWAPAVSAAR